MNYLYLAVFLITSVSNTVVTNAQEKNILNNCIYPVSPSEGQILDTFLTSTLRWDLRIQEKVKIFDKERLNWYIKNFRLTVSKNKDMSEPLIDLTIPGNILTYRIAAVPETKYYWRVIPSDDKGEHPETGFSASFITGKPRIDTSDNDSIRYGNPREGAHYLYFEPLPFKKYEPLSPWYEVKSFRGTNPPLFEELKDKLPVPVLDGQEKIIEAYWYCWKTLMDVWYYAPEDDDHQAVANINGIRSWGPWGSTMVWDSAFMQYFAKYGNQAYPFITSFDNCYARMHENGFICRESDRSNREVYVLYPVNPPLFAWIEWEYYKISNDKERLQRVLLPIVKHYEWWMKYQRRESGVYWTDGFNEADDSPRNQLMFYALSASSYQALAAQYIAKIAHETGRKDIEYYFTAQHKELGDMVNRIFWDEKHKIYNDLNKDGKFITETEPNVFCKHGHMFWPLLAGIAPKDRAMGMVKELRNPSSFNRRNGVPSLSADSREYRGGTDGDGQYWKGAVWPPIQCVVQEGLRQSGEFDLARALAEKYLNAVVETFTVSGDITENLAPDIPKAYGAGKFVGWGGIGPIANLIEYILGFEIDVPQNIVTWRVNRLEKHGLKNMKLGTFNTSFICEKRASATEPCHISVESDREFDLNLVLNNKPFPKKIRKGINTFVIP